MNYLKGSLVTDGKTVYRVAYWDKGWPWVNTHPPVAGEQAIPIPVDMLNKMKLVDGKTGRAA